MNIIKNKNLFFIISGLAIIPGIISIVLFGLKSSIDFTGGSEIDIQFSKSISKQQIFSIFTREKLQVYNLNLISKNEFMVRTNPIDQATRIKLLGDLKKEDKNLREKSFETVGPIIGRETELNAFKAVIIASIAITLYIAFAFRKVSHPVSSWKYGACAIAALMHDVLVVVGAFSILGHFAGVEVDSLFITALLTVMGFSVHDTIVVFDRIRENLRKNYSHPFEEIVNNSLLETLNRSVNTSLTVLLVLFSLLMFGGESIRWFVVALLLGIISGTYSSIFNASPLLVLWYEINRRGKKKE